MHVAARVLAKSPQDVEGRVIRGQVAGSAIWAETDISTRTRVSSGPVTNLTTEITSNSIEMNRFFIVLPDGSERPVKTWNLGFAVRDGNDVSAVYMRVRGGEKEYLTGLLNHSTGQRLVVDSNIRSLSRADSPLVSWLIRLGVIVVGFMTGLSVFVLALVGVIGHGIWRLRVKRAVDAEGRRVTAQLLDSNAPA